MVTAADNPNTPSPAADSPADSATPRPHPATAQSPETSSTPLTSSPHHIITPPLSPLTPRQSHLLDVFFKLRGDILALAESERLSAADLNAWSCDPAVQQHIAALYDLHEAGLALAASRAKRTALDTLEGLARTAEDPIERRRAAAAIIRPGSTRDINRPFVQPDDTVDLDEDEDPNEDQDLDEDTDGNQSDESDDSDPSVSSVPSVPSEPSHKLHPSKAPYPFPHHSDQAPINAAIEALKKPRDPDTNCRPYNFFLPDATACGLPIPKDPDDYSNHFAALFGHADALLHEQRHFCARDGLSYNNSAYRLTFQSQDGRPFEYHIELTRPDYGDFPKCWRIKSLNWTDRQNHVDPKLRAKAREAAKSQAPDSDAAPTPDSS